jgi:SAM-dependent methyltransferase
VDVFPELIEYLCANVTDSRFNFEVMNTHNEMYNPTGLPLTAATTLRTKEHSFDIICLFSVFTHLAPHDYVAMLQMLRRYIKPGGRIIFSLFVNELTRTGEGFIDAFQRGLKANIPKGDKYTALLEQAIERGGPPDFFDFYPAQPLKVAMYSREHALKLVENTGWEVESLNDPERHIQHYMICKPI